MIIIRDGKEIELTADEMRQAYYECQSKWDLAFIREEMEYVIESEDDELVALAERCRKDEDYAERVALRYREYADEYPSGDAEWDCIVDALRTEAR